MPPAAANETSLAKTAQASGEDNLSRGLTSDEARSRLTSTAQMQCRTPRYQPWRMALAKFWAPVPWMLEAAIILQTVLHEYVEAAVIAGLLVFNAALGFFQEGRAQATLAALKSRLALTASVRRDGAWKNIPATELVPGDTVKLSLGGVVAADVKLVEGSILLDQSMLTGESVPIEAGAGPANLCRGAGAARRSHGNRHRNRGAHEVWTYRGTRPHRPCREHPAKNRRARGAQSCHLQWRNHRLAGGVRSCPQNAGWRDHSSRPHGGSGVDPCSAARHVYPCSGAGRKGSGALGCASNAIVRRGRSGNSGRSLLGQDGDFNSQRTGGHCRSS